MAVISILALVMSIVAVILAFIFIVPDHKREGFNKFWKFVHDTFNFKYLIVEKILQALYIFATVYVILFGFCMLFYVQPGYSGYYYSRPAQWLGGYGLLIMILGPIAVRLAYELIMMSILLVKNVIQINTKLQGTGEEKSDAAPVEFVEPTPAVTADVCPNCGAAVADAIFCANCGTKVK